MGKSRIEWTGATWNPVTGCTKVSHGCTNCYAERMAQRLKGRHGYSSDEPFQVMLHPNRLDQPLRWRKGRRIFVCSMSDLFHEAVPDEFIAAVFGIMGSRTEHTFQLLTKRPKRMREILSWLTPEIIRDQVLRIGNRAVSGNRSWPLPNVWIGVSAENQVRADDRIPFLLHTPAAVRFVSCEPLLGPIDLRGIWRPIAYCGGLLINDPQRHGAPDIDWVIAGGESGPNARPSHPDWFRSLRDQCDRANVPFFFKQWGKWAPVGLKQERNSLGKNEVWINSTGAYGLVDGDEIWRMRSFGKSRMLDGETWDQYPGMP